MKLDKQTEEILKQESINYLKECKPDWDIPHTLASVDWMKKLIEKEGGNERILVTAMYLHDIGYPKLEKGYNFDDLMKAKKNHAETGAEKAENVLIKLGYSADEIKEIIFLIASHYHKESINTRNQQLVLEADSLAKIDWENVKPNFDKENTLRYFEYFKGRSAPRFKTETGKKFLKELMQKAEHYLNTK
jgi:putative nucleotidyltransferase with HDIG domain